MKATNLLSSKKKWVLPSLLVTALAVNSYFQTTSLVSGFAELASTSAEATEAAAAIQCKDGNCTMTQAQFNNLMKELREVKQAITQKAEALKPSVKESADDEKETAKERKERLAAEKKEKMEEDFKAKVDKISDKCDGKDLDCYTSAFTSLLSRQTGSKKLDSKIVSSAFNTLMAKPLREALKSSDSSEVMTALSELISEIPEEYRGLRQRTIDIVKLDAQLKGQNINNNFKAADLAIKQKNSAQAQQYLATAQTDLMQLQSGVNTFNQSVTQSLIADQDSSTLNYLRNSFRELDTMFLNITSVTGSNGQNNSNQNNGTQNQTQQPNGQPNQMTIHPSNQPTGTRGGVSMQMNGPINGGMNNAGSRQGYQSGNMMVPQQQQFQPQMPQQMQMQQQNNGVMFRGMSVNPSGVRQ